MKLIVVLLSIFAASSLRAQALYTDRCPGNAEYRGRCVDISLTARNPGTYAECDKQRGRSQAEVFACILAVGEAKNMASYFAAGHGQMVGVHRGLAAGMHDGEQRWRDDPRGMNEGARRLSLLTSYMDPGLSEAARRGETVGRDEGAGRAQSMFERAVMDNASGTIPAKAVGPAPTPAYGGESDGFRRVVVPQNRDYAILGPREILQRMERDYARYNHAYDNITREARPYVGEYDRLSLVQLWYDDGVYPVDSRRWLDPQVALRTWLTQSGIQRTRYDTLNRHAPPDVERDPKTGDPVAGPDGKPVCRRPTKDSAGNVTGCAPVDVQAVFQKSFADAYAFYAPHAYSTALYEGMDRGYRDGVAVGTALGGELARQRGMVDAFDEAYRDRTRERYGDAFRQSYVSAFDSTYERHRTKAVLLVELVEVIGTVPDGILQPGESYRVRFRVTNSGGMATPITAKVGLDSAYQDRIGALMRREYTSGVIGRVDPSLRPGAQASVVLTVNGIPAEATSLTVRRAIQLDPASASVDATRGSAQLVVSLRNISTARGPSDISVITTLAGASTRKAASDLSPGTSTAVIFPITGRDPMTLMFGGEMLTVRVEAGGQLMDEQTVRLMSRTPREDLARYVGMLLQSDPTNQLATAMDRVVDIDDRETRGASSNPWKSNPRSTMAGLIADEAKGLPTTVDAARVRALGDRLWEHRNRFGKFLFFKSGKRRAYESLVRPLRDFRASR